MWTSIDGMDKEMCTRLISSCSFLRTWHVCRSGAGMRGEEEEAVVEVASTAASTSGDEASTKLSGKEEDNLSSTWVLPSRKCFG